MVLKQAVILEGDAANASKNSTLHEVIRVASETVDDIMVIPDIDLRNLRIGSGEGLGAIPCNVVVEIESVACGAHFIIEWIFFPFLRIGDVRPGLQRSLDSDTIIVDLIPTANHDMKWALGVFLEYILP